MVRYFGSALTILLAVGEIEPKGLVLIDGFKTLVGFHGLVLDYLVLAEVQFEVAFVLLQFGQLEFGRVDKGLQLLGFD